MTEFLTKTFYGNTVETWLIFFGIVLAGAIIGRFIFWIFKKKIGSKTAQLKNQFFHVLVDLIEEPIAFAVVLFSIWIGLKQLTLPDGFDRFAKNAFNILWTINITWLLARLWGSFVTQVLTPLAEKSESNLDDALLPILKKGVRSIIWIIGIIVGLNNAGYDVGTLLAGLGIGGMALALAAKDILSNMFGGLTIFLDHPFRMGDRIIIDGYDGTVIEIGIRTSRIRTLAGRIVTVPNAKFNGNIVENISMEPSRKMVVQLGLTYDTPDNRMEEAMSLLKEIDSRHQNHLQPDSKIAFTSFGDFSLGLTYIYYIIPGEDIFGVQTKINIDILKTFNNAGLEFAFPSQTLYLEKNA